MDGEKYVVFAVQGKSTIHGTIGDMGRLYFVHKYDFIPSIYGHEEFGLYSYTEGD